MVDGVDGWMEVGVQQVLALVPSLSATYHVAGMHYPTESRRHALCQAPGADNALHLHTSSENLDTCSQACLCLSLAPPGHDIPLNMYWLPREAFCGPASAALASVGGGGRAGPGEAVQGPVGISAAVWVRASPLHPTPALSSPCLQETQELQKKQQWYQENQVTLTPEDEDWYLSYCSQAMFRIRILEQRLNR